MLKLLNAKIHVSFRVEQQIKTHVISISNRRNIPDFRRHEARRRDSLQHVTTTNTQYRLLHAVATTRVNNSRTERARLTSANTTSKQTVHRFPPDYSLPRIITPRNWTSKILQELYKSTMILLGFCLLWFINFMNTESY